MNVTMEHMKLMSDHVHTGLTKTLNIIESMRMFSSNSQNKYSNVDLNEIVNSTLPLLYNSYKDRIDIQKDLASGVEIRGDSVKLHQIVLNIISNSIDAIQTKGSITITTKLNSEKNIAILEINDDGCGMSEDVVKKIYDPFFTTKETGKGTGLGLYLTYQLVKFHGGNIKAESVLDKGTKFKVELPVH
jgi:signal transduction histidine kinase